MFRELMESDSAIAIFVRTWIGLMGITLVVIGLASIFALIHPVIGILVGLCALIAAVRAFIES